VALTTEQIDLIKDLLQQGETKTHIADIVGCSSTTIAQYVKKFEEAEAKKKPSFYGKESVDEKIELLKEILDRVHQLSYQLNSLPYFIDERLKKTEDAIVASLAIAENSIERKIRR